MKILDKKKITREEADSRGGQATAEKYGPEFYREIGHRGGTAHRYEDDRRYSSGQGYGDYDDDYREERYAREHRC